MSSNLIDTQRDIFLTKVKSYYIIFIQVIIKLARMAELADALDLESSPMRVQVQVLFRA